jgi:dipeptidyl aminopeptidase/acylaminoacyl peptidase
MSISAPPRPPSPARTAPDAKPLEREEVEALVEALFEEARRETRRRRRKYWAVAALGTLVGVVVLYWFLGSVRAGSGPTVAGTPHAGASPPKVALPQELSFNANGSVVLLRRDGRRLPFLSGIFQPRGERQRHLYAGVEWSPDGSKLLAQRWGYGLRALEVTDETGKVVWTVADRYVSDGRWSPDGTRVAFVHVYPDPAFDHVLFVASIDRRVLTRIQAHVREFSWSPDGTKLAYPACASTCGPSRAQGAHRLVIADATGRRGPHPVPLPASAGAPGRTLTDVQWSPDGSLIAFVSHDDVGTHLNVVHPDGRSLRRVAEGDLGSVRWSPDGSLIAFVSQDDVGWHLDVVHPDGSSLRRVADGGPLLRFEWSPEGKRLATVVPVGPAPKDDSQVDPRPADVSVVNADGTDLHRIARCRCDLGGRRLDFYESVAWSLDGTRIAYISGRGNTVSTIRPDGSGATLVATQPARAGRAYWYPSFPMWRPSRASGAEGAH